METQTELQQMARNPLSAQVISQFMHETSPFTVSQECRDLEMTHDLSPFRQASNHPKRLAEVLELARE